MRNRFGVFECGFGILAGLETHLGMMLMENSSSTTQTSWCTTGATSTHPITLVDDAVFPIGLNFLLTVHEGITAVFVRASVLADPQLIIETVSEAWLAYRLSLETAPPAPRSRRTPHLVA